MEKAEKRLAPIALFVYKRPEHTRRTVEALRQNELAAESELIVFSDGPRNENDNAAVAEVRAYLHTVAGFKSVAIREQSRNLGLANSIIAGVTEVVNQYGRIIVLEDDLLTSPYFLRYMNDALDLYESEEKVISIHGYVYPVKKPLPETFFLPGADCWGWATWKRGWDLFESDSDKLLAKIIENRLKSVFNVRNSFPFMKMLKNQRDGKIDSWAIRWRASAIVAGKLTLYPGKSLVKNIGFDASGTHCSDGNYYETELYYGEIQLVPLRAERSTVEEKQMAAYFRSDSNARMMGIIIRKVKMCLKKLFG